MSNEEDQTPGRPPPVVSLLSIQGGGFKGYFSALVLCELEAFKRGIGGSTAAEPLVESFDMLSGASAGAIVAAGLAAGATPEAIAGLMRSEGEKIFPARRIGRTLPGVFASRFGAGKLREVLESILGEMRLGQVETALLIPAVNLSTGQPVIFRSWERRYQELRLVDVVLASAAAPTYLPRHRIGRDWFADGGLVANGPALLAARDMARIFEVPVPRQRIVSIGTTFAAPPADWPRWAGWGLLGWALPRPRLIETLIDGQMKLQQEVLAGLDPLGAVPLDQEVSGDAAAAIHLVRADPAARRALEAAAARRIAACTPEERNSLRSVFMRRGWKVGAVAGIGGLRPALLPRPAAGMGGGDKGGGGMGEAGTALSTAATPPEVPRRPSA